MKFSFKDEQLLFAEATREMLRKDCSPEAINEFVESDSAAMPELWNSFASMGVLGITASETLGGLEMLDQDFVLIMEELGRAACPEPVMEHAVLSIPLLEECNNKSQYTSILESAINGEHRLSVALESQYVVGADSADYLLLFRDSLLHLVAKESIVLQRQASVDSSRRLFSVKWDTNSGTVIEGDSDKVRSLIEITKLRAEVSTAAQCIGVAQQLLDMTVQYVQERKQFGKSISEFQGISFKLVDMATEIEAASLLTQKASEMKNKNLNVTKAGAMAKLFASETCVKVASESVQIHGGYGFTKDFPVEKYYRDAKLCTIGEGTSEIQKLVISREILK